MRAPEEAYNAKSRRIEWKLDIFFNGVNQDPVSIVRDNFLISAEVLEEAMSSSNTPWGNVSANELTASIRNEGDIFNPGNIESPYYGKIKEGLMIAAFMRPATSSDVYDWDPCGIFYVADWVTRSGGLTAEITCYDKIADVLNAQNVKLCVYPDIAKRDFVQVFFDSLNVPVIIDPLLTGVLPFGYHVKENKDFLNTISSGLQVFIFCDHSGIIQVQYMRASREVSHTITDNDQIIDISAQRGVMLDYDGIQLLLKAPQLSDSVEIYSSKKMEIPTSGLLLEAQLFTKKPVAMIELGKISNMGLGKVLVQEATSLDCSLQIINLLGRSFVDDISLYGRIVETSDTDYSSTGRNLLKYDNIYCQTVEQFESTKRFLSAFVSSTLPQIELTVRGNPQFALGQKIRVSSFRFNLNFTGLLIRQKLHYDGGLSSTLTLMNSTILEVE